MSKDPAILFYTSDFLTGTMHMNYEQKGIYICLLCSQHQHGGIIDKESFNIMVGSHNIIRNKFIETETGFYNKRMMEEMHKREIKSNNLSIAAKDLWRKRKENDTIVLQLHNNCDTKVIQIESESESEIKKIKELKTKYLDCVFLSEKQYSQLIEKFGEASAKEKIETLNNGIMSKGYKYKSHYHTILSWDKKNNKEKGNNERKPVIPKTL